jgi:bis(5'-nucleosyl)-tetraphosphatase (symmetrical)
MSTFVIGDIQGCYQELQDLLQHIKFHSGHDHLWLAGDLVNRGPQSLEVLRFIIDLPYVTSVLGNHDLHLLALWNGAPLDDESLGAILEAPDCDHLMHWLRQCPLIHTDGTHTLVHAGIPPQWNCQQAHHYSQEVAQALAGHDFRDFLTHMYGNSPDSWDDSLTGNDRLRYITNALTRIRCVTSEGKLNLEHKGRLDEAPGGHLPWFAFPGRASAGESIIFGHWAAINGVTHNDQALALDTGCVWGKQLTALRLDDMRLFHVPARVKSR